MKQYYYVIFNATTDRFEVVESVKPHNNESIVGVSLDKVLIITERSDKGSAIIVTNALNKARNADIPGF